MPEKWLAIGKIVNTHGIRGEVKVISSTDFPEIRFAKGSKLYIFKGANSAPAAEVTIAHARSHKNFYLVKFEECDNINDVETYKGAVLKVHATQLIELPEDEYYFYEIAGCKVVDENGCELGTVTEILTPGANDVWVVQRPGKKDLLLPVIDEVVLKVDIAQKTITVRLMEGLI